MLVFFIFSTPEMVTSKGEEAFSIYNAMDQLYIFSDFRDELIQDLK